MKNFDGRGGRSVRRQWSIGGLGLALAFVVGVFALSAEASGNFNSDGFMPPPPGDGWGPTDDRLPPPKPPWTAQDCMEDFLRNEQRCKDIWCEPASFLGFNWTSCDDTELEDCTDKAKTTFDCCISGRLPC